MLDSFFKDLKVIEFASVLAGPAVGLFFAELGAEVIKIENKKVDGDVTRKWKLPTENKDADYSAYYCSVNWHKQVKMMDLSNAVDQAEIHELVKEVDIIISNFKPVAATRMQMDYEKLSKINPKIIYAQLTGFGEKSQRLAYDVVLQAEAGFLYMCGEPGRPPVKMPVALIDILSAHQLKEAILIGLIHRMRTGEGTYVSTSLLESAIASLANQATNWLMGNHIPQAMGTAHPNISPYGDIFFSKDELPIIVAVGSDRQFAMMCKLLDIAQFAENELFSTNAARVKNRILLKEKLTPAFQNKYREPLLNQFHESGIPAGSIRNMKEVFEIPATKDLILEEVFEDGKNTKRVKTVAFKMK